MRKVRIDEFGVITGMRCYFKGGGGGGSSGGGGGGSGAVDYPAYMKTFHEDLLNKAGTVTLTNSIAGLINTAHSNNPFTGENAYDPGTDITAMETALSGYDTIISGVVPATLFSTYLTAAIADITTSVFNPPTPNAAADIAAVDTDTATEADAIAFGAILDDQITTTVLPRFQRGMQDINAVQSSTFVIGQSNIEGFRDRDVAKHLSGLRARTFEQKVDKQFTAYTQDDQLNLKSAEFKAELIMKAVDGITKLLLAQLEHEKAYALAIIEQKRIKIVAKNEQNETDRAIDENEATWNLEVMQHGANMLASIGGGVAAPTSGSGRSQAQRSAIGGALAGGLSGAAAGAMVGGPWGAAIGGAIGIGASFL